MSPSCICGGDDLTLSSHTRHNLGNTTETQRTYRCGDCGGTGVEYDVDGGETRHTGCLKVGR